MMHFHKAWISLIFLSMLFFNGCVEHKNFNQTADILPICDSTHKFLIEKNFIRIENDTNDRLIAYYTYLKRENTAIISDLTNSFSLNIVNLNTRKRIIKRLPDEIVGIIKKAMPFVQFCQKDDSIYYFLAQNDLIELNVHSLKFEKRKLKFPLDFDTVNYRISAGTSQRFGFPMYFENTQLHFETFLIRKKNSEWTIFADDYPYEIHLSLDSSRSFSEKVDLPDFVVRNYYQLRFDIYRLNVDKVDILGFPFTANMYVKDKSTELLKVVGGKSKFQSNDFINPICDLEKKEVITRDSCWYYYNHNEYYSQLIYNSKKQQYYRLYHHELSQRKSDGFYNTHMDRVVSIQIFNSKLSLVHEEVLKEIWGVYKFFPFEDGFVINNNGIDPKNDHYDYVYYSVK